LKIMEKYSEYKYVNIHAYNDIIKDGCNI
jgi:hypothetical protein